MNPDPNRYEASRPAFEALHDHGPLTIKTAEREYAHPSIENQWIAWCRALDHAAAQVCEWTLHDNYWYMFTCGKGMPWSETNALEIYPFCPACGRRVKIQPENTANQ